jgi:hypothetical protein
MPDSSASWAKACTLAGVLMLGACQHAPPAADVDAPHWAAGWQSFELPGKARTRYVAQQADGRWIVHAQAQSSASMYRRTLRIEPDQIGSVAFSWKVRALNAEADVRHSDTEDAVVRVLLAFDGDHDRLSPRNRMMFDLMQGLTGEPPPYATLMYVWDRQVELDAVVLNPRSDRIRKIVLESGDRHLGQWRVYRRNIREDFRRAFGEDPGPLIGVALMTDADNTQGRAEAWYGEIRFD